MSDEEGKHYVECPACEGTGLKIFEGVIIKPTETCEECRGKGFIREDD